MRPKVASSAAATPGKSSGRRESASKQVSKSGFRVWASPKPKIKTGTARNLLSEGEGGEKWNFPLSEEGDTDSAMTTPFLVLRNLSDY